MLESWRKPDRVPRAPAEGSSGGGSPEDDEGKKSIPFAEWEKALRETGISDSPPDIKGKKQKAEYARIAGEQAVSVALNRYRARDQIGFESALKTYAQSRARGAGEDAALLGAARQLEIEDMEEFKKVIGIVNGRLEHIGVIKPEPPMSEEELLKGLEGLQPPPEGTPEQPSVVPEPHTPPNIASGPKPYENGLNLKGNPPPPTPEKVLKHAPGTTDAELFDDSLAREDDDIIEKHSSYRQAQKRDMRRKMEENPRPYHPLGRAERARGPETDPEANKEAEKRIAEAVDWFKVRAFADNVDPSVIYQIAGNALPSAMWERYKQEIEKHAHINGTLIEEVPDLSTVTPQQLGEEDGTVGNVRFWRLPGGEALLWSRDNREPEHFMHVARNGIQKVGSQWYRFDPDAGFIPITEEELTTWRTKEETNKRLREYRLRNVGQSSAARSPQHGRAEAVPRVENTATEPLQQQLSLDENNAPSPASEDDYGAIEPLSNAVETRDVADAQSDFTRLYTDRDKLAEAYHEAVRGLSVQQRTDFDDGLYAGYPELPEGILAAVINHELRTNPPPRTEQDPNIERRGTEKAYQVFRREYSPFDRGSLAPAYRKAIKGLSRSEREEFDDGLYRTINVPDDILTALINEELKKNRHKDREERRERPARKQPQGERSQRGDRRENRRRQ